MGDLVIWKLPELHLVAEGGDHGEAEEALVEQIELLRHTYLDEPEDKMTADALEFRAHLREILG